MWKGAWKYSLLICITFIIVLMLMHDKNNKISKSTKIMNQKYNLMEETQLKPLEVVDCTLEYANSHQLQQDHPCVLELIREKYFRKPFPFNVPLNLFNTPRTDDPSAGQATAIMRLLGNLTNGFFVECGASDGEFLSNTLYMERFKNWTGILIEPETASYQSLLTRKRKAWSSNACLSLDTFPKKVYFKSAFQTGSIKEITPQSKNTSMTTVQCFPLYSFLLAYGRTSVDFFSLDVEGHELKVLRTIPWHKIDVKTLAVEWEHVEEGSKAIEKFMEYHGFVHFGKISTPYARDMIFVKDYLRNVPSPMMGHVA